MSPSLHAEPTLSHVSGSAVALGYALCCSLWADLQAVYWQHGRRKRVICRGVRALGDPHRAANGMVGS